MKKYINFAKILESKGVPDNIFDFVKSISNDIVLNKNSTLKYDINYDDIKASIILNISYIKSSTEKYKGNIQYLNAINKKFEDVVIKIIVESMKPKLENIVSAVLHELTHLYELYNIKDFFTDTKWNRTTALYDTKKQENIKLFKYYRDLFYLTLPQEVNARVSSVYYKLYVLNSTDQNFILSELKNTMEWKNLENIKNFNYKTYTNDLIKKIGLDFSLLLVNEFNKIMSIKTIVSNKKDLYNYFKKYKRFSMTVYKHYKQKLLRIVKKICQNLDENFCNTDTSIDYENYIDD